MQRPMRCVARNLDSPPPHNTKAFNIGRSNPISKIVDASIKLISLVDEGTDSIPDICENHGGL